MKNLTNKLFLLLILSVTFIISCQPDDSSNDPTGDPRDSYTGNWLATETSTLYPDPITFVVKIEKHPSDASKVYISNFYHFGPDPADRVIAIVSESTITVEPQQACGSQVNGSGNLIGNKISWIYWVNDGADNDKVTSTYVKQ